MMPFLFPDFKVFLLTLVDWHSLAAVQENSAYVYSVTRGTSKRLLKVSIFGAYKKMAGLVDHCYAPEISHGHSVVSN